MPERVWWNAVTEGPSFDVIVIGGGSAGTSSAIAAARAGARVLLVDKLGFLGGTSTAVLDTMYGFYSPGEKAKRLITGVGSDVVDRLTELGPVLERPNTYGAGTGITYNSEHLKVVWESLCRDAGVTVLQHSLLQDVYVSDGRVMQVLVATKAGLRRFSARTFLDCSGDADLCSFADFSLEIAGEIDPAQSLTTTFKIVNVDMERRRSITKDQLHELMEKAADDGYQLPRKEGSDHVTPIDGMTATVMTRLPSYVVGDDGPISATDPWFLSQSEHEGHRQVLEYMRFLTDRVPGYEEASLVAMSAQIGIRETRRVHGDYRLTRDDVLTARQFDDQVGLCGAPIEDHRPGEGTDWVYLPEGDAVGIPLRTLIVTDASNVLVAGRCFSATHDAHASVRSIGQCIAMGQAAGTVAALSLAEGGDVRAVRPQEVRARLREDGATLEVPD